MHRGLKQPSAHNYASAVIRVLSEDFPDLNDETTRTIVRDAIERHVLSPTDMLEVIVDSPYSANWRLKADRNDIQRVRLSCYRMDPSDADRERERRINTALAAIAEN
jgi:hypothetical protein